MSNSDWQGVSSNPYWRKSSRCEASGCVEVAFDDVNVLVRHSKDPEGFVLMFTLEEWRAFAQGVKRSEFDF